MKPVSEWNRVAIADVETTGTDKEKDRVVEAAIGIWDLRRRCLTDVTSFITQIPEEAITDEARASEGIHGVPLDLCPTSRIEKPREHAARFATFFGADAWLAYQSDFDESFLRQPGDGRPWVDVMEMPWPKTIVASGSGGGGRSLTAVALAHGVAITKAHRALSDVLIVSSLLERACELGADVYAMLTHAARPRAVIVADAPRSMNETLKQHFFRWDPDAKRWWRKMAVDDAPALPFRWHVEEAAA